MLLLQDYGVFCIFEVREAVLELSGGVVHVLTVAQSLQLVETFGNGFDLLMRAVLDQLDLLAVGHHVLVHHFGAVFVQLNLLLGEQLFLVTVRTLSL